MLQEVLLCIAGYSSPLQLSDPRTCAEYHEEQDAKSKREYGAFDTVLASLTPTERGLLSTLCNDLGGTHRMTRDAAVRIRDSPSQSTVCRAVASSIVALHLEHFRDKILSVEKDILTKNSSMVGAENIVPLSALVTSFDGWSRKLAWLLKLVQYMQCPVAEGDVNGQKSDKSCTAVQVMEKLRDEAYTGYTDIEQMSLDLSRVAGMAWLKQLSLWILYGQCPDSPDFFIARGVKDAGRASDDWHTYALALHNVPHFVTPATATSILFIGKSLNHIRARDPAGRTVSVTGLEIEHIRLLTGLTLPVATREFTGTIKAIRTSLSQNVLQKLLPLPRVLEALATLRDYFLFGRGDFATALVGAADERMYLTVPSSQQHHRQRRTTPAASTKDVARLTISDGEVEHVLIRAFTTLACMQSDHTDDREDPEEEGLERARDTVTLNIKGLASTQTKSHPTSFDDLLLPTPTLLKLNITPPLDLFLTSADMDQYAHMSTYLLSLRRAQVHLNQLYLYTSLRRQHPSRSCTDRRSQQLRQAKELRSLWTTIALAALIIRELTIYFHSKVLSQSWETLLDWVTHSHTRPVHDPESLAAAHRLFLGALQKSLFLEDQNFTSTLRRCLTGVDHLCGLVRKLDTLQQIFAAQSTTESGDGDEHTNGAIRGTMVDMQEAIDDLEIAGTRVQTGMRELVSCLKEIDLGRARETADGSARSGPGAESDEHSGSGFRPWAERSLDALLLMVDAATAGDSQRVGS